MGSQTGCRLVSHHFLGSELIFRVELQHITPRKAIDRHEALRGFTKIRVRTTNAEHPRLSVYTIEGVTQRPFEKIKRPVLAELNVAS